MVEKSILNLTPLKDQVYEYLRHQMKMGKIKPGSSIDMNATCKKLGVSKTPLRDALLELEIEGFVRILPRRGIIVNALTVQDIKDFYQILGALESMAVISASDQLGEPQVKKMRKLNEEMKKAIDRDNFNVYYEKNLKFHDVYIDLSGNKTLKKTVTVLKKRLYDFPRRVGYIKEWEIASIKEHEKLVDLIARKKFSEATDFIRDVHWSFTVQEKYIKKYYVEGMEGEKPEKEKL